MLVWYAAYGSNTDRSRFGCYLAGGTPAGSATSNPGCTDPADPLDDRPAVLPFPLSFGGHSARWGGAVAFVEPAPVTGTATLARAYLVTDGQLTDVIDQENRRTPSAAESGPLDLTTLDADGGGLVAGTGVYDVLVGCGRLDGAPVVTLTSSAPPPPGRPAEAYLTLVAVGLVATGRSPRVVAEYLAAVPGVAGCYDPLAILALLLPN